MRPNWDVATTSHAGWVTVPIEKEVTRIDKNREEVTKIYPTYCNFFDSARFMASSWSNLANNLSEWIPKIKCKYGHNDERCETCRIKYKYCNCFLEYIYFKEDLIEYKCLCCNKNSKQKLDEKLKEQFFNALKFSNHDNSKFILLLQKGVYPYEYMGYWEKFKETSLPEKEDFHSYLNMKDITDVD